MPEELQKAAGARASNREADGTWLSGLQFLGVNDLTIEQGLQVALLLSGGAV